MQVGTVQVFDAELGLVRRQKTLSNSASEFIENHPVEVFGQEASELTGSTFVPELDSFVADEDAQQPNYYAQSEERLVEFKKTLTDFVAMIKDRKLDKKLDIELKRPDRYTMYDVVMIATKMEQRHKNAANMKSCMGVIRKVFRKAGDHKSTLKKLLTFCPNDSYGTVIMGGFTLILGAIDRADNLRQEIATAIAAIPEKLEHTKILLGVYKSSKLHFCADGVFMAVFSLLIHIVKELDKSLAKKGFGASLKGDRYGFELSEAIKDLDLSLQKFKDEAELCAAERLGRIERHAVGSRLDMADIRKQLQDMDKRQADREERAQQAKQAVIQEFNNQRMLFLERMEETEKAIRASMSGSTVMNNYYTLFASSPYFDPRTGTLNEYQAEAQRLLAAPTGPMDFLRAPSPALSIRSTDSMRACLDLVQEIYEDFDQRATWRDVEESLDHFEQFSGREKDRARYILCSEELDKWLQAQQSQTLVVEPATAPDEILNPLAFAAAFLAKSFKTNKSKPTILCFHCGIRANAACEEELSGPLAMLNCLNAQLLTQTYRNKGSVHIPILDDIRRRDRLRKRIPRGLKLFRQILDAYSSQDPIFIVIDSLSRMPGSQDQREEVLEGILSAAEEADAMVKIVLTDICSLSSVVEDRDCIELYVEDKVDGWKQDASVEHLDEDSRISKKDLRRRRRRRRQVESESDDSDSDDSDDDSD